MRQAKCDQSSTICSSSQNLRQQSLEGHFSEFTPSQDELRVLQQLDPSIYQKVLRAMEVQAHTPSLRSPTCMHEEQDGLQVTLRREWHSLIEGRVRILEQALREKDPLERVKLGLDRSQERLSRLAFQ